MSVLRPRKRLVNFRLSQEEYEKLKTAFPSQGARSISDFARTVVLRSVGLSDTPESSIHARLSSLGSKVAELEARLAGLVQLLNETPDENRGNASLVSQ